MHKGYLKMLSLKKMGITDIRDRGNQRSIDPIHLLFTEAWSGILSMLSRSQTIYIIGLKSCHTKYWLSNLDLYRLYFCLIICISMYVCRCINKSLLQFPIILSTNKKMGGVSWILQLTVRTWWHIKRLESEVGHSKPLCSQSAGCPCCTHTE